MWVRWCWWLGPAVCMLGCDGVGEHGAVSRDESAGASAAGARGAGPRGNGLGGGSAVATGVAQVGRGPGWTEVSSEGAAATAGAPGMPPPTTTWSGAVGSWCGPGDQRTVWLVVNPEWAVCAERSQYIQGEAAGEGFSVELPEAALRAPSGEVDVNVRRCSQSACETLPATLSMEAYDPGVGALGRIRIGLADGGSVDAEFRAGACVWDDHLPATPGVARAVRGLRLHEVALFQAVKVPVMRRLEEISERNAELVAGRGALLRAYVVPEAGFLPRRVRGRLTLVNHDEHGTELEPEIFETTVSVRGISGEAELGSTFNFEISPESLREDTRYSIELLEAAPCAEFAGGDLGTRFPAQGTQPFGARPVGKLRILLVPVRFVSGATALLPDASPEQIELFRTHLTRMFPITGADIAIRPNPVTTDATDIMDVLDQIIALRDEENVERDLAYYGMVRFSETLDEYCAVGCVLGAGVVGEPTSASADAAVGIGYPGEDAASTFAHEIGHVYGRRHSPCGVAGDPAYPYSRGSIGGWGYDLFERRLIDPLDFTDFMGYCAPVWVSDYVYSGLMSFIRDVNGQASLSRLASAGRFRTLILGQARAPRWGLARTIWGEPRGIRERADVYDVFGRVVTAVDVYRSKIGDLDAELVYVPERAAPAWSAIRIAGQPLHFYDAPITVPRLRR